MFYIEIPYLMQNSVDPDQTPLCAASDLGLHCLPMSLLWDARHKWIKMMGWQVIKVLWSFKVVQFVFGVSSCALSDFLNLYYYLSALFW